MGGKVTLAGYAPTMDLELAQALLFAAIPPLVFIGTVGAANFKPDMPSPLGKMVVGFVWHIAAWASLITFLAYWAWTTGQQWLAVVAALAALPAYIALGTVAVFSRRAFGSGKKERG